MRNTEKEKKARAIDKCFNQHGNVERDGTDVSVQLNITDQTLFVIAEDGTACAIYLSKVKTVELSKLMGINTCS